MRIFRRSRSKALAPTPRAEIELAPKLEQAIVTLAVHAQQIDTRLDRIEERLDSDRGRILSNSELSEILDIRLHSSKVATELTRLSTELRDELAELNARVDELGAGSKNRTNRMIDLARQIIDLSDSTSQSPSEIVSSGTLHDR